MAAIQDIFRDGGAISITAMAKVLSTVGNLVNSVGTKAMTAGTLPIMESVFPLIGDKATKLGEWADNKRQEIAERREARNIAQSSPLPSPQLDRIEETLQKIDSDGVKLTPEVTESIQRIADSLERQEESERQEGDIAERLESQGPPTIEKEESKPEKKQNPLMSLLPMMGMLGGLGGMLKGLLPKAMSGLLSSALSTMPGLLGRSLASALPRLVAAAFRHPLVLAAIAGGFAKKFLDEWDKNRRNPEARQAMVDENGEVKDAIDYAAFNSDKEGDQYQYKNPEDFNSDKNKAARLGDVVDFYEKNPDKLKDPNAKARYDAAKQNKAKLESRNESKSIEVEQVRLAGETFIDKNSGFLGINKTKIPANRMNQAQVQALDSEDRKRYEAWLSKTFEPEEVALVKARLDGKELTKEQQSLEAMAVKPGTFFGETYAALFGNYTWNKAGAVNANAPKAFIERHGNTLPSAMAQNFMSSNNPYLKASEDMANNATPELGLSELAKITEEAFKKTPENNTPPIVYVEGSQTTVINNGGRGGTTYIPAGTVRGPEASGMTPLR